MAHLTKKEWLEDCEAVEMVAEEAFEKALGSCLPAYYCGYLWAKCTVNGKSHKFLVGGFNMKHFSDVQMEAVKMSAKEIDYTYINMD